MLDKSLVSKIESSIRSGSSISFQISDYSRESDELAQEILHEALRCQSLLDAGDSLSYCLKELIENAERANLKRVYFKEKSKDINDAKDYAATMAKFHEELAENRPHYVELARRRNFVVSIKIMIAGGRFSLFVQNNVAMTIAETTRVKEKLSIAKTFAPDGANFFNMIDNTEGAGLGLILTTMMLKKIGMDDDGFVIQSRDTSTLASVTIPISRMRTEQKKPYSIIAEKIVESVNNLPHFRENIVAITKKLNSAESSINEIANLISADAAISADLLRLVNSAAFSIPEAKRNSIPEATKAIGMRGVKNLMLSIGAMESLGDDSEEKRKIWQHSQAVAQVAQIFSREFRPLLGAFLDDVYVCALLHDIGKILFCNVDKTFMAKMYRVCDEHNAPRRIVEVLVSGWRHDEIGAMIAEKWNFSETIVTVIRHHHNFNDAPENLQRLVAVVELADALCNHENDAARFNAMPPSLPKFFGINDADALDEIWRKIRKTLRGVK